MVHTQIKSEKFQYFATFVVNLFMVTFGMQGGWSSPSIFLLVSDETPLSSGKITMEEASWVAAMCPVGALFGSTFFKFIIKRFGRKLPFMLIQIPWIMNWLLIWFAQNPNYLYAARFIGGFVCAGGYVIAVILLNEISNDNIRGTLVSSITLSEVFGILLSYIIGHFLGFYGIPLLAIVLSVIFIASFNILPETPLYLMKRNDLSGTEQAVRFYKNLSKNDREQLDLELLKLKIALDIDREIHNDKTALTWSDVTSGVGRKAMTIGIAVVMINTFSGMFAMTTYTATIFKDTGSNLSPNMSAIVIGVIQFLGCCAETKFVDKFGRKKLFVSSCFGTALGQIVLGVYLLLKLSDYEVEDYNWIPLISFSWTYFASSLGIHTLTMTLISEIMPQKIKEAGVSFCVTLFFTCSFLNIKFLPTFIGLIGFHGSLFIFATVCLSGAIFNLCFVPETKGKNHEEIIQSLK